jgi:hypothetical protein
MASRLGIPYGTEENMAVSTDNQPNAAEWDIIARDRDQAESVDRPAFRLTNSGVYLNKQAIDLVPGKVSRLEIAINRKAKVVAFVPSNMGYKLSRGFAGSLAKTARDKLVAGGVKSEKWFALSGVDKYGLGAVLTGSYKKELKP